jgi:hypothetical protein
VELELSEGFFGKSVLALLVFNDEKMSSQAGNLSLVASPRTREKLSYVIKEGKKRQSLTLLEIMVYQRKNEF